jgi:three-Cys-motif partner protein
MAANHYKWEKGGTLPKLLRHSSVKHSLLRDYLVEYFVTLVPSPSQDHIKLTIVDGFCGGGRFSDEANNTEVPGSPIIILQAIKEAEARIFQLQQRKKPLNFDVELICIDDDRSAINHLKWVLEQEGYGQQLQSEQIRLIHGSFENNSESVIKRAKDRSMKAGKAIFVLDQYGYSEVPLKTLNAICTQLAKAEVILTFNVDSLINYLNEDNLNKFEKKTGFEGAVTAEELDALENNPNWRKIIQSKLYENITRTSGAKYFTPFFIRPARGHGDFWLLHLSQHAKARDVMAATHWLHNNHFVHYGDAGLDMFGVGYAAVIDREESVQPSFDFDYVASERSHATMLEEIPKYLEKSRDGILFGDFFAQRCNNTPATRSMVVNTVLELVREEHLEVLGENQRARNVRTAIQDDHIIKLKPQKRIIFY